uniref:Uncharacterized protein n=1 Tax=Rhodnius prolixus TaxID=13249 RepID=T1I1R5_RHOPR
MMELQDFFQIGPLKFLISEFLNTTIDINNAWAIKREAEFRRYKDVAKNAFNFIKENFGLMIEEKDFLEVTYEQLKECLVSDHLAVPTEDRLLIALTTWVSHHPEERLPLLDSVLAKVEVSRIEDWKATARTVMDLFPDEVHRLSVATWLANAQLRRFSGETRAVDRYKQYASDVLLAIGGIQDKGKTSVGTIECLTALGEPWKPILSRWRGGRANNRPDQDSIVFPVMHTPRRHPSVASTGDTIYVLGGTPNGCELEVYKLKENKWFVLPSFPLGMDIPPAMALIDGHLYASGGLQKSWVIPSSHMWIFSECAMEAKKGYAENFLLNKMGKNEAIFINSTYYTTLTGGGRVATATFEKYDPSLDVWVNLPSMTEPRAYHGCVPLGPHIYLLTHCAVQRYDTQKNVWETMCSSHTAKQDPDEPCPHPVECTRNSVYAAKLNKNLVLSRSRRESLQVYNCATNKSAVWPTLSLLKKTCVALTTIRVPLYSPPPV